MANVRKSQALWEHVERQLRRKYEPRRETMSDFAEYGNEADFFDQIYKALFSEDERGVLEKYSHFFRKVRSLNMSLKICDPDVKYFREEAEQKPRVSLRVTLSAPKDYYFPPNVLRYNDQLEKTVDNTPAEVEKAIWTREHNLRLLRKEEQETVNAAKTVWDTVASVNKFVLYFPGGFELLTHEAQERLRQKQKRSKTAAEEGIDQEALNALKVNFAKAKITQ